MKNMQKPVLGEKTLLRTGYGPVSFGWIMAQNVVSWSGPDAQDILISRCWEGLFLYPSRTIDRYSFESKEIKICPNLYIPTLGFLADWNRDGRDDLIVTDRHGFLYYFERKGEYPGISFEYAGTFTDAETGLLFNIPYDNPNHMTDDIGGYIDPLFFNYTYPVMYRWGDENAVNFIIGDWSGNLWWMPGVPGSKGRSSYKGVRYAKNPEDSKADYGRNYLKIHGSEYVKPSDKICDENGNVFLLGDGVDGGLRFEGSNVKPFLYRNNITGSDDLIVIAGMVNNRIYYFKQVNGKNADKPAFKNMGELVIDGLAIKDEEVTHSSLAVFENEGRYDLLISLKSNIAVLKNKRSGSEIPEFVFYGFISAKDAVTGGYLYTEILKDNKNRKRFVLDNTNYRWELSEISNLEGRTRLSNEKKLLYDQNGVFKVEGGSDPYLGREWGVNNAVRWDFDGSGRQHLIVGTDQGYLYLLIDDGRVGEDGNFTYRSVGPLKDRYGKTFKVHNRLYPAAVDLNRDGLEDLVIGGASYQNSIKSDPNPGGGIYYMLNCGTDARGLPVLDSVKILDIKDFEYKFGVNRHIKLQAVDLDTDGCRELIISSGFDGHTARVFKISDDFIGVEYTGMAIPGMAYGEHFMDIDGDDALELVFAGDEPGVGYYRKLG